MLENWYAMIAVGVAGLFTLTGLPLLLRNHQRFKSGLPPALYAQLPLSVVVKGVLALTIVDIIGMKDSGKLRTVIRALKWLIFAALRFLSTRSYPASNTTTAPKKSTSAETTSPLSAKEQD
jgi:hypothetical protein